MTYLPTQFHDFSIQGKRMSETETERIMRREIQDRFSLLRRLTALESQVTELVTILDTLTDKLIEAGVLVKRKEKE